MSSRGVWIKYHKESPSRIIEEDRGSDQEHGGSHELAQLQSESVSIGGGLIAEGELKAHHNGGSN
jgi:hypothetical protein